MRPLRPLFNRHHAADALARDAERLRNRDWVEILRVVHPSQADSAEREYLLARLSSDWAELTSPLLATHSLPTGLNGRNLMVACDHNTFANELSLIAPIVEKKVTARYAITVKIQARASRRMDWQKAAILPETESMHQAQKPVKNPMLDQLIASIERIEKNP